MNEWKHSNRENLKSKCRNRFQCFSCARNRHSKVHDIKQTAIKKIPRVLKPERFVREHENLLQEQSKSKLGKETRHETYLLTRKLRQQVLVWNTSLTEGQKIRHQKRNGFFYIRASITTVKPNIVDLKTLSITVNNAGGKTHHQGDISQRIRHILGQRSQSHRLTNPEWNTRRFSISRKPDASLKHAEFAFPNDASTQYEFVSSFLEPWELEVSETEVNKVAKISYSDKFIASRSWANCALHFEMNYQQKLRKGHFVTVDELTCSTISIGPRGKRPIKAGASFRSRIAATRLASVQPEDSWNIQLSLS